MKLKNKFAALLLCLVSPAGEVVAQTPRMERMMDKKQQNIVTLAALTAVGDLDGLKVALGTSLTDGMTVNEVKEVLVHTLLRFSAFTAGPADPRYRVGRA